MLKFDIEELKTKLADWVLNAHLPEVLGMNDDDKDDIKESFEDLVTKGILVKDGQRRGLKFKFNTDYVNIDNETSDTLSDDGVEDTQEDAKMHDIHTYIKERDSIKASVKACNPTFDDLFQWILDSKPDRDPSITSTTLALKKMSNGSIVMRVYAGVVTLIDKEFPSVDSFKREMKKLSKPKGDK